MFFWNTVKMHNLWRTLGMPVNLKQTD
jgi:hypothetical protein